MKGYFYRGKSRNFYYDIEERELLSYGRYRNGTEEEGDVTHILDTPMDFDTFMKYCEQLETEGSL